MSEAADSNSSFIEFWKMVYPKLPRGEFRELNGLTAVWGDVDLAFCNAVVLSRAVEDARDLNSRVRTLQQFLATKSKPPMFLVCKDWIPASVRPLADGMMAQMGLEPLVPLRGMAADEILAPVRQLPRLEFRRVSDAETCNMIADINSAGYGINQTQGREAFGLPAIWSGEQYAYVGFWGGEAVTTAAAAAISDRIYVGFVATMPRWSRHGFAETVMRHAVGEARKATGIRRSVLHATQEGRPIYLRMGYRETASFMGYVAH